MCMKTAGVDYTASVPNSRSIMRFCSKQCSVLSPSLRVSPYIEFWDQTQNPPAPNSRTCTLHDSHKELLYIYAECTMSTGYNLFDITVCTGSSPEPFQENKVYAVCYCRQRTQQVFFEFFFTDDLKVHQMIALGDEKDVPGVFTATADSVLQMIIKQALATKGIQNIHKLMELYNKK